MASGRSASRLVCRCLSQLYSSTSTASLSPSAGVAVRGLREASSVSKHPATIWRSFSSAAGLPPHAQLTMPSLSPTMTQGNIISWKKKEGDSVAPGDVLAEVETDKATLDWEAQEEGFIAKILRPSGSNNVPVGTPVAIIVEESDLVAKFKDYALGTAPAKAAATPQAAAPPPPPAAPAAAAASAYPPHQVMTMPSLSPTMSQGNIATWNKKVGDEIKPGDTLCEVETDKATMGWDAQEEGFLAAILAPNGTKDITVGAPVAVVVEDKDFLAAFKDFTAACIGKKPAAPAAAAPKAAPAAPAPPPPKAAAPAPAAAPAAKPAAAGERLKASPYARKLAAEAGADLTSVSGSGPGGRIVAADVAGARKGAPAPAAAAGGAPAAPAEGEYTDIPNTQIRRITAARLLESKTTVPHYYLTMEVTMDSLTKLREQINTSLAAGSSGGKLSVNDFIVKACALALRKVPAVNSQWNNDFIRQFHIVDVSVAVQTPHGLMTPIVRNADAKGLLQISSEVKELAGKAKERKLKPDEFTGGTFTISNLGMFGIKQFAAIINPPQAAIIAVGGTDKKVVITKDGSYKETTVMLVTLSCDHRVVDGAVGSEWLLAFKSYIENPLSMLI